MIKLSFMVHAGESIEEAIARATGRKTAPYVVYPTSLDDLSGYDDERAAEAVDGLSLKEYWKAADHLAKIVGAKTFRDEIDRHGDTPYAVADIAYRLTGGSLRQLLG